MPYVVGVLYGSGLFLFLLGYVLGGVFLENLEPPSMLSRAKVKWCRSAFFYSWLCAWLVFLSLVLMNPRALNGMNGLLGSASLVLSWFSLGKLIREVKQTPPMDKKRDRRITWCFCLCALGFMVAIALQSIIVNS